MAELKREYKLCWWCGGRIYRVGKQYQKDRVWSQIRYCSEECASYARAAWKIIKNGQVGNFAAFVINQSEDDKWGKMMRLLSLLKSKYGKEI